MIRESHRRQFAGEDYQYVANGIAESNGIAFESGRLHNPAVIA